jgi:hypothetical protein
VSVCFGYGTKMNRKEVAGEKNSSVANTFYSY